jgi:RNAse (barnase) inhibitor barstar
MKPTKSNIPANYYTENKTRYVFIDGAGFQQMEMLYKSLQQQLSLPAGFGNNLDALEEMLADLDWIKEEKVKIILLNSTALLANLPQKKQAFIEVLKSCDNPKLEIVMLG